MVVDEAAHKETLVEINGALVNSTVAIDLVLFDDFTAEVTATETATFMIDGETKQEIIGHSICVYQNSAGCLIVGSDGYAEETTGFISASYISEETVSLNDTVSGGSSRCIVDIAREELGTTAGADGTTIYGRWYGGVMGDPGYYSAAWCAMFVAWCANRAGVPISVVPLTAYVPTMAGFFNAHNRYYHSTSGGGNYTPEPGDIIFIGVNDNDTFRSPGHVGIVSAVYGNTVYYVDGNATSYNSDGVGVKKVSYRSKSLTATDIIAFGNPNYAIDTHTVSNWEYDSLGHWAECEDCHILISEEHFFVMTNEGYIVCDVCGYC